MILKNWHTVIWPSTILGSRRSPCLCPNEGKGSLCSYVLTSALLSSPLLHLSSFSSSFLPSLVTKSMYVYDASCHAMRQCVYAHYACRWGTRSKCQKLCAAGLVGVKRTIPGLWRLPDTCFLHFVLFLLFWFLQWTDCVQHSFLHLTPQIRMLQRPSCAILPVLYRQETLSPHRHPEDEHKLTCPLVMQVALMLLGLVSTQPAPLISRSTRSTKLLAVIP